MHPSSPQSVRKATEFVVARNTIRIGGIGSTVFGVLALFLGVIPPADPILLGLGAVLAGTGLWNLTNPGPISLALSAASLAMVGLYNVVGGFVEAAQGVKPFVGWQVLGVWQLIWSVQEFRRYRRFSAVLSEEPSPEVAQEAKRMVDELRRAKPKTSPDVLEFVAGGWQPVLIRVRLMPTGALCLIGNGDDVMLLGREGIDLSETGRAGQHVKVTLRAGSRLFKGAIKAEMLERYQSWSGGGAEVLAKAA